MIKEVLESATNINYTTIIYPSKFKFNLFENIEAMYFLNYSFGKYRLRNEYNYLFEKNQLENIGLQFKHHLQIHNALILKLENYINLIQIDAFTSLTTQPVFEGVGNIPLLKKTINLEDKIQYLNNNGCFFVNEITSNSLINEYINILTKLEYKPGEKVFNGVTIEDVLNYFNNNNNLIVNTSQNRVEAVINQLSQLDKIKDHKFLVKIPPKFQI